MAVEISSLAWRVTTLSSNQKLTPSHKLVLIRIADMASTDGECFPRIARIAEDCNLSPERVRAILRDLDRAGHLTRVVRSGGCSRYRVHPRVEPRSQATGVETPDPGYRQPGTPVTGNRTPGYRQPDLNRHLTVNEPPPRSEIVVNPAKGRVMSRVVDGSRHFLGPDGSWNSAPSDPKERTRFFAWCAKAQQEVRA